MIKRNIKVIVAFLMGAILFGGMGVVLATNIASSSVNYTTSKNANVANVEDALDDLYDQIIGHPILCFNGTCGKVSFRYWNDEFGNVTYQSNALPTNNYATRILLEQNYGSSNFASRPYYIRSILIDGNVVGHQACIWYNNREFCIANKYWAGTIGTQDATAATQTKIKLQRDMQESLGITIADSSCGSDSSGAHCFVGDFACYANYDGNVGCRIRGSAYCYVRVEGTARCFE